jgi:hypothetical protein
MVMRYEIIIQKAKRFLWSGGIAKPLNMTNCVALKKNGYAILFLF